MGVSRRAARRHQPEAEPAGGAVPDIEGGRRAAADFTVNLGEQAGFHGERSIDTEVAEGVTEGTEDFFVGLSSVNSVLPQCSLWQKIFFDFDTAGWEEVT